MLSDLTIEKLLLSLNLYLFSKPLMFIKFFIRKYVFNLIVIVINISVNGTAHPIKISTRTMPLSKKVIQYSLLPFAVPLSVVNLLYPIFDLYLAHPFHLHQLCFIPYQQIPATKLWVTEYQHLHCVLFNQFC